MDGVRGQSVRVGEAFSELLWPTRCVGCNMPSEVLCPSCRAQLPWITQRWACPVCGAPYGWLTCTQCDRSRNQDETDEHRTSPPAPSQDGVHRTSWPMRATICAVSFENVAARMVTSLKDAHELRLAPLLAAALCGALEEASAWPALDGLPRYDTDRIDALCFVPATREAYARRGFDHMELVSRSLAALTGLPLADVLVRAQARDQRMLGKEARTENLAGTVRVADDVSGLHLLLADDVVTTGASLGECTRALLARGAASVTACAFSRVW